MPTTILTLYTENRKEFTRFAKFAVVGLIGTGIDFGILNLMVLVFGWPPERSKVLSASVAILSNFTWNRLWTYPESRSRPKREQFVQFTIVNVIGLAINFGIFWALHPVLAHLIGDPLGYNLANVIAIGVVLFWNFGANRLWTYRGL